MTIKYLICLCWVCECTMFTLLMKMTGFTPSRYAWSQLKICHILMEYSWVDTTLLGSQNPRTSCLYSRGFSFLFQLIKRVTFVLKHHPYIGITCCLKLAPASHVNKILYRYSINLLIRIIYLMLQKKMQGVVLPVF